MCRDAIIGGRIRRGKTDGTGLTDLLIGLDGPRGIAVDAKESALYWSDAEGIHRASQDGTGAKLIFSGVRADALALDP